MGGRVGAGRSVRRRGIPPPGVSSTKRLMGKGLWFCVVNTPQLSADSERFMDSCIWRDTLCMLVAVGPVPRQCARDVPEAKAPDTFVVFMPGLKSRPISEARSNGASWTRRGLETGVSGAGRAA